MGRGGGFMADNKDMMMLQQQNPFPLAHRLPSALPPHLPPPNSSLHKRRPPPLVATASSSSITATATATSPSPSPQPPSTAHPSLSLPPAVPLPPSSNISKHKKKLLKVILKLPKTHPHHTSPVPSDHPSPSSSSPSRSPTSSSDTPSRFSSPRPSIPPHQQPQQHLLQRQQQHQQHQHQHQRQQRLLQQQHYQQQQLLLQQQQQLKIELDLKLQQQQHQHLQLQQHHPELLQQLKLQHQLLKHQLEDSKQPKLQQEQDLQQSLNSPKKVKVQQQQPKLPPQRPPLQIPSQSLKKLSQNPTPESHNQYGLSPSAQTGKVPIAPSSSFTPPTSSAPLSSPPALAATPTSEAAHSGQKPSKKRKLKAVVDSLGRDIYVSAATKVASRQTPPLDGLTQSTRTGLISASSTDSHLQQPQPEVKLLKDRDVSGLSSEPVSDFQYSSIAPSKKLLEGILGKLQKKDTYGVFSEPVDPKLVPDYYDFIKDPMDFGTMRKRVASGFYTTLEPFQKDIFLICSNAMRYNARETIYYKQARSIQDATRRILDAIRTSGPELELDEVLPKPRQSQVKKAYKKHMNSWFDRTGSDPMSGVTLATGVENCGKTAIAGYWNFERQSASVSPSETKADNNEDLSASLVKSSMFKDGRKAQVSEENRRSTYKPHTMPASGTASVLTVAGGDCQQLVPMGYQFDFPYARSLARFAADLGPAVWKVAAEKIKRALPPGFPFGPGWVGEREVPGGAFIAPLNKSQSHLQPTIQSKFKPPIDSRQLTTRDTPSNRENLLKVDHASPSASHRACSSTSERSVDFSNSSYHQSESKALTPTRQQMHQSSDLLEHPKPVYQDQPTVRDASRDNSHSRALGVGESKHNEMPNQNRSVSWFAGKHIEKVPISAELPRPVTEKYASGKLRDENEVNEITKPMIGNRPSSSLTTVSASLKQGLHVGSNQSIWQSHPSTNEDCLLLDQSLLSSSTTRNHQIPPTSNFAPGAPSVSFSTALPHLSGAPRVQEDGNIHGWAPAEQSDLSQVVGNACLKVPLQLPGNSMQCQSMGSVQYSQLQDGQPKVGFQARAVSQHSNKLSPSIPHFLQQQFAADVHSFSQQQQVRLQPQGNSKPAAAQHGGYVDSHDASMLRHSNFPTLIGTGISQSQNQVWQYAGPQFVLQGPELPFSAAPDLNASLQPSKTHFDNPTGSELQPDLVLQL